MATREWVPIVQFESLTSPGVLYTVSRDTRNGNIGCNCPGWRFRKECRHITLVKEYGADQPGMSDSDIRRAFELVEIRIKAVRDVLREVGALDVNSTSKAIARFIAKLDAAGFTKPLSMLQPGGKVNPRRQRLITIEE